MFNTINESKNIMLILNKSHSHTIASFFFFQTSMVISSIQHNQISKIKFYIILNVKKKREEKYKD